MPATNGVSSATLLADCKASIVVFLVALPLCLGIALASGAPLLSGLLAGIVGGTLVGLFSGSHTSVSGPAAGLSTIVAAQILSLGSFEVFLLAVMVAGLITVAVANKEVITHPNERMSVAVALLLFGGPVLFLLAEGWYLWAVPHVWPRLRVIGSAALFLVGFASWTAPSSIALILAGVTLATLAILDQP